MKIAIETSPLSSGHSGRGIGGYTKYLIEALQKYETKHSYTFFTRGQNVPENADLVHYPYFDPYFLTLPLFKPKPVVVTVHDMIPLVFPDKFPAGLRGRIKWQIQKLSLTGTRRIITDSKNSKKDIAQISGIPENRIDVVYLAASSVFRPDISGERLVEIHKKYSLPERFILYVGDVNWNKNVPGLIRAFARCSKDSSFTDIRLVLVGKPFLDKTLPETGEIMKLITASGVKNSVIFPGFIPDEDLGGVYKQAVCLVQPSYYEGFGLPVLEAFAAGCPVVCSDTSSLSEIIGPAIRVQPDSAGSIISGMKTCVGLSSRERSTLIGKGAEWANKFTWKKVANETVLSYERTQP